MFDFTLYKLLFDFSITLISISYFNETKKIPFPMPEIEMLRCFIFWNLLNFFAILIVWSLTIVVETFQYVNGFFDLIKSLTIIGSMIFVGENYFVTTKILFVTTMISIVWWAKKYVDDTFSRRNGDDDVGMLRL